MELEATMACLKISDNLFNTNAQMVPDSPKCSDSDGENVPSDSVYLPRPTRLGSVTSPEKRRVQIKPTKMPKNNFKKIDNYYLDKRIKRLNSPLETIYEDPGHQRHGEPHMALNKFRQTNFGMAAQSMKIMKRKMKTKQLPASQRINNRKMIAIKYVIERLNEIKDE